jgi:hypothetical protein
MVGRCNGPSRSMAVQFNRPGRSTHGAGCRCTIAVAATAVCPTGGCCGTVGPATIATTRVPAATAAGARESSSAVGTTAASTRGAAAPSVGATSARAAAPATSAVGVAAACARGSTAAAT